jgi:hypothetical protein
MKYFIAAALALGAVSSLDAQTAADYGTATPIEGNWSYLTVPGGSEATFANAAAQPQLTIGCSRATRQVSIARPGTSASPSLSIWTSAQTRNLPASYNPATGRISATVSAYDPFLDSIAFSRGRIAVTVSGQATLIAPAWAELARVVEDCRV